jgi:hypothetical protein
METGDVQIPCGVLQGVLLLSLLICIGLVPVTEYFKTVNTEYGSITSDEYNTYFTWTI